MRHVARTHRVDLDWMFQRLSEDPGINIKYVGTKQQIADMLTKASFTAEQWKSLLRLSQIGTPYPQKDPPKEKSAVAGVTPKAALHAHVTNDVQYFHIGDIDEHPAFNDAQWW